MKVRALLNRLFTALLCLIAVSGYLAVCTESEAADIAIGKTAPDIQAFNLGGEKITLSGFKGKVVVVRFWSGVCRLCLSEMPKIEDIYKKHKEKGLEILAVYKGDPKKENIEKIVRRLNISYTVLLDSLSINAQKYRVTGVPVSFIIDRQGILREKIIGEMPVEIFEKKVTALLLDKQ